VHHLIKVGFATFFGNTEGSGIPLPTSTPPNLWSSH